jgi:putative Mn2+ efflux pump MntP
MNENDPIETSAFFAILRLIVAAIGFLICLVGALVVSMLMDGMISEWWWIGAVVLFAIGLWLVWSAIRGKRATIVWIIAEILGSL